MIHHKNQLQGINKKWDMTLPTFRHHVNRYTSEIGTSPKKNWDKTEPTFMIIGTSLKLVFYENKDITEIGMYEIWYPKTTPRTLVCVYGYYGNNCTYLNYTSTANNGDSVVYLFWYIPSLQSRLDILHPLLQKNYRCLAIIKNVKLLPWITFLLSKPPLAV